MTAEPGPVPSLVTAALTSICFTLQIDYSYFLKKKIKNGYNNISTLHEHAGKIISTEEGEVCRHSSD